MRSSEGRGSGRLGLGHVGAETEVVQDLADNGELESVLGDRGTEEVSAQFLDARALVAPQGDIGMEIEAVDVGLAWGRGGDPGSVGVGTERKYAVTGAGADGASALDGCTDDARQRGRDQ